MEHDTDTITFTLYGKTYTLSRAQVEAAMEGWNPGRIQRYSVKIGRKRMPIKEVLASSIGVPPAEFTSQQAYGILRRLGFEIEG